MLRKILTACGALAALLLVSLQGAAAQQRIALVIGNAAYPKGPLQTSLADGGLVAEALTSIGFEIVEGADVNGNDMRRLFGEFLQKVNAVGPDTIAFIYYNGYAIQFEGDNYLIPVDAQLNRDSAIPIEGIRLFDLLRPLADTPATAKIVVLDAAHPLPFRIQGSQGAPGLGAIESAPGMLVAFASAPGTVAQDGSGPYGAYATAIAEMVREPGLDIDTLFARIRLRTNEATNGVQTPWEVSQLQQIVMLVPGQPAAPPPGAQGLLAAPQTQVGAPVVRRRAPPRPIRDIGPEEAYGYAVEQDDLPTYSEYVRIYPDSPYTPRVWAMIRARREALLWRHALLENSPEAYWTYIERYPEGLYAFDARRRLRRLAAGDHPPPGWRMRTYDDVPMPLAGEPARIIEVMPPAPPPRRWLGPPPAYIVSLPPPPPPGGGVLWRRQQPTFPVIVAPPAPRPNVGGGAPQGQQRGPAAVNQPPAGAPPGPSPATPPAQPNVATPAPASPPPAPPAGQPKGPVAVTPPPPAAPAGAPPAPPAGQPKGTGPAVVTTPPPGAPTVPPAGGAPAAKGPPPAFKGAPGAPPAGQKGPAVVKQPPSAVPPPSPPAAKGPPPGPPPQQLKQVAPPTQPQVAAPPPPKAPAPPPQMKAPPPPAPPPPPPQVKAAPPPPPPPPAAAKAPPPPAPPPAAAKGPPPPPGPPAQAQKGPPPGAKGLPKCAAVNGKQPCTP